MLFSAIKRNDNKELFERSASSSLHDESTIRLSSKPPISLLENGKLVCSSCKKVFDIKNLTSLSLEKCPLCGELNFIPKRIKEFWLYEPLGGGGMGSVYHALHAINPSAEFAVKIIPRERKNDHSLIASLLNEAHNGKQFGDHPHIAKVYDYGRDKDEYYAVYEFIDGIRLDQIIDSPAQRPMKQLALWALQILSAEQHIYDRGYLYRDLKPQNILIDRNGNVKLIDFGLAMKIEDTNKQSDEIEGSPYYIPPERITGEEENQSSEIYSLGMVLFHLIAKRPYYSAEDVHELVGKHVISLRLNNAKSKLPKNTDTEILRIIDKMIERDKSMRYQSYKEAGKDLFKYYKECAA